MADELELAYFAGFFDGEGSVGMYEHGRYVVNVANTDVRPLARAKELWGGHLNLQGKQKYSVRDLWHWNLYGHFARPFLEDIRPYSRLKAEQIDVYLDALSHVPTRGQRRRAGADAAIREASTRLKLLKRGEAA